MFRNCEQNSLSLGVGESNIATFPRGHSFLQSVAYETFAQPMDIHPSQQVSAKTDYLETRYD